MSSPLAESRPGGRLLTRQKRKRSYGTSIQGTKGPIPWEIKSFPGGVFVPSKEGALGSDGRCQQEHSDLKHTSRGVREKRGKEATAQEEKQAREREKTANS